MRETTKQIIEIIEPFMDKTLSEGCLYKHKNSKSSEWVVTHKIKYIDKDWWLYLQRLKSWLLSEAIIAKHQVNTLSIIWHYDITAVLKWINKKRKAEIYLVTNNKFTIIVPELQENWFIPNKPLHLYTEEENKDLLELFDELWTN